MKKAISIFIVFVFLSISCASVKPRDTQETEMLSLLNQIAPLAKQINDINNEGEKFRETERNSNNSAESKAEVAKLKQEFSLKLKKRENIQTEMSAYQVQFYILKDDYIRNFGEIAYNEFIKKNGFYWGLGIHW